MSNTDDPTCEETVRRLDDYLDRELNENEMALVRQHLKTCELCANGVDFEGTVLNAIRSKLQEAPLPDGLRGRVFDRLRDMENEKRI